MPEGVKQRNNPYPWNNPVFHGFRQHWNPGTSPGFGNMDDLISGIYDITDGGFNITDNPGFTGGSLFNDPQGGSLFNDPFMASVGQWLQNGGFTGNVPQNNPFAMADSTMTRLAEMHPNDPGIQAIARDYENLMQRLNVELGITEGDPLDDGTVRIAGPVGTSSKQAVATDSEGTDSESTDAGEEATASTGDPTGRAELMAQSNSMVAPADYYENPVTHTPLTPEEVASAVEPNAEPEAPAEPVAPQSLAEPVAQFLETQVSTEDEVRVDPDTLTLLDTSSGRTIFEDGISSNRQEITGSDEIDFIHSTSTTRETATGMGHAVRIDDPDGAGIILRSGTATENTIEAEGNGSRLVMFTGRSIRDTGEVNFHLGLNAYSTEISTGNGDDVVVDHLKSDTTYVDTGEGADTYIADLRHLDRHDNPQYLELDNVERAIFVVPEGHRLEADEDSNRYYLYQDGVSDYVESFRVDDGGAEIIAVNETNTERMEEVQTIINNKANEIAAIRDQE